MSTPSPRPEIAAGDHKAYMQFALSRACLSPPAWTKFSVGAVLVDAGSNTIISTGYSLELPEGSIGEPGTFHLPFPGRA